MYNIAFYMKSYPVIKRLEAGEKIPKDELLNMFESFRSKHPIVYNIETTNACNMKCEMCPRTTMMTRKTETLDQETFEKIVDQITPFSVEEWKAWELFVEENYKIAPHEMSENHFFLYIIPLLSKLRI